MTAPDAGTELVRGRLMKASLGRLLDQVQGSREALPHLAALEKSLGQRGAAAIDAIPEHWRVRISAQLGSLPLPEEDAPLQDLRRRLAAPLLRDPGSPPAPRRDDKVAGAAPQPGKGPAAPARPAPRDSAFDPERTVVVRELTHSEFMSLTDGQTPGPGDGDPPDGQPRDRGTV